MASKKALEYIREFCKDREIDLLLDRVVYDVVNLKTDQEKKEWLLELKSCARKLNVEPVWRTSSDELREFLTKEFSYKGPEPEDKTLNVSWDCLCGEGTGIGRYDLCPNCDFMYEENLRHLIEHPVKDYVVVNGDFYDSDDTIRTVVRRMWHDDFVLRYCTCQERECSCDFSSRYDDVQVGHASRDYDHDLVLSAFGKRKIELIFAYDHGAN